MPKTNIGTLKRLIKRSILLTKEQKRRLLRQLKKISEKQVDDLIAHLKTEPLVIDRAVEETINRAEKEGDIGVLRRIENILKKSWKSIRKGEERFEHEEEEEKLEHFFDDEK